MNDPVRVAIVEDDTDLLDGLALLIDNTPGFRCVGRYGRMEQGLAEVDLVKPTLFLVDLDLPGMSGVDGIRAVRARDPDMPVVVLTIHNDDDRVFASLCAGATGYLLKTSPPERLRAALTDAIAGGSPISPEVARRVVRLFRDFRPPDRATYKLTPQETALLKLLVDGHHYKTAASELGVSVHTVSFHLKNIYTKLHVHSKTEAVAKALRDRLV